MKTIYIAIQDVSTRSWAPVARVDKTGEQYRLRYTKGAEQVEGFDGFVRMQDLQSEFISSELFPLLKNRVLPRSRPEFASYARWLGRDKDSLDFFEELALTGGLRGTDNIELIPMPEKSENGTYDSLFFVHGVRHLSEHAESIIKGLSLGSRIYLAADIQNEYDMHALLLRTGVPVSLIGYVPRYYSQEFSSLLQADPKSVVVTIEKVNISAPPPFRVLCKLSAPWPESFTACQAASYQLLVQDPVSVRTVN